MNIIFQMTRSQNLVFMDTSFSTIGLTGLYRIPKYLDAGSICEGDSILIFASGGLNFQWENAIIDSTYYYPNQNTSYVVNGDDNFGCIIMIH